MVIATAEDAPNNLAVERQGICVGKLVAAHGYRQKRGNKLEIKK
jgi:hypothetical protein